MHGIIYNQFYKFVRENYGTDVLKTITKEAGLSNKFYDATKAHPDEDLAILLKTTCQHLAVDRELVLEKFGQFIAPGLLQVYKPYIKNEWRCMDLLENVESTIHKVVRRTDAEADPPRLVVDRNGNQVKIQYASKRNMLSLGVGIVKAIAEHYNERVSISMSNGTTDIKTLVITKD